MAKICIIITKQDVWVSPFIASGLACRSCVGHSQLHIWLSIRNLICECLIDPDSCFIDCGIVNIGSTYIGKLNVTKTGRACQAWSSNFPHKVAGDIKDNQFPDNSTMEALNYCRNPQATNKSGIWCYTTDPNVEWEYCDPCPENYREYRGMISYDFHLLFIQRYLIIVK